MKPRKVTLTLEVTTDAPMADLKKTKSITIIPAGHMLSVDQCQVNVVKPSAAPTKDLEES